MAKYTVTTASGPVEDTFSRKEGAIKAGLKTGESFQVFSPSGAVVHDYVAENEDLIGDVQIQATSTGVTVETAQDPAPKNKPKKAAKKAAAPAKKAAAKKTPAKKAAPKTCKMKGCDRPVSGLGLCKMHHTKAWRESRPEVKEMTLFTNRRYAARKRLIAFIEAVGVKKFDVGAKGKDYSPLPEGYTAERVDSILAKAKEYKIDVAAVAANPSERGRPNYRK